MWNNKRHIPSMKQMAVMVNKIMDTPITTKEMGTREQLNNAMRNVILKHESISHLSRAPIECSDVAIQFTIDVLKEVYKDCIDNIVYPVGKNKEGAGRKIEKKITELTNLLTNK